MAFRAWAFGPRFTSVVCIVRLVVLHIHYLYT